MKAIISILLYIFITGCSHNIKIVPEASTSNAQEKSKTVVGFYISDVDKKLKTTTPGGGGDKVSYMLTSDMEYGFFNVLNNAYETVKVLNSSHDIEKMKADGVKLVFEPVFLSRSSGSSMLIWPADDFSITVKCKAYNQSGSLVLDKEFIGRGTATSQELMKNFAIAANRAATDVLKQLDQELKSNSLLK